MIKNLSELADRLKGIKVGDKDLTIDMLKELMSKQDEVEISIPKVHVLTEEGLTALKETVSKKGYGEGKDAGEEMLIKDMKKKLGLEYDGKDADQFITEFTKKIEKEKGIEPNKKISELSESLSNLQKSMQAKDQEIESWKQKYSGLEKSTRVKELISTKAPKLTGLTNNQFAVLLQTEGYNIEFSEGGESFVTLHGKPLKDSYEKYIPVESVLLDFATKNKWVGSDGRGDGDKHNNTGTSFKNEAEAYKYMKENNIDPLTSAGDSILAKVEAGK
jgi:SPX domain protein involved in polyphosphate accumulation